MNTPIQTRWHKLIDCVNRDIIALGGTRIRPSTVTHEWRELIHKADRFPKFVMDPDLMEAMDVSVVGMSIKSMIEAEVLRLPYRQMILECTFNDLPDESFFAIIEGSQITVVSYYADSACLYPTKFDYLALVDGKGSGLQFTFRDAFLTWDLDDELSTRIDEYLSKVVGRLLGVAFVVTNLQGVDRQLVECPALNKQRVKKGKVPVPSYTYLRIGHVYKRTGERIKYVKGSQTKVYMRRGHTRNQAFGKGNLDRKLIYIEPVLVNYRDTNDPPPTIKVKW